MPLHRLIYVSEPIDPTPNVIEEILSTARRNNEAIGLSGMLLFTSDHFVQVIEGRCKHLSERLIIIGSDPRHRNLHIRSFEPIDERLFANWRMQYVSHDTVSLAAYKRFFSGTHFEPALMSSSALLKMCLAISDIAFDRRAA